MSSKPRDAEVLKACNIMRHDDPPCGSDECLDIAYALAEARAEGVRIGVKAVAERCYITFVDAEKIIDEMEAPDAE